MTVFKMLFTREEIKRFREMIAKRYAIRRAGKGYAVINKLTGERISFHKSPKAATRRLRHEQRLACQGWRSQ